MPACGSTVVLEGRIVLEITPPERYPPETTVGDPIVLMDVAPKLRGRVVVPPIVLIGAEPTPKDAILGDVPKDPVAKEAVLTGAAETTGEAGMAVPV